MFAVSDVPDIERKSARLILASSLKKPFIDLGDPTFV